MQRGFRGGSDSCNRLNLPLRIRQVRETQDHDEIADTATEIFLAASYYCNDCWNNDSNKRVQANDCVFLIVKEFNNKPMLEHILITNVVYSTANFKYHHSFLHDCINV